MPMPSKDERKRRVSASIVAYLRANPKATSREAREHFAGMTAKRIDAVPGEFERLEQEARKPVAKAPAMKAKPAAAAMPAKLTNKAEVFKDVKEQEGIPEVNVRRKR